jgi:hypothetical protein
MLNSMVSMPIYFTGAMQPYLFVNVDWGSLSNAVLQAPVQLPPVFPGIIMLFLSIPPH